MPVRPSCVVPLPLDRTSWRRSFGSWCSDATNLTKVEAKMNSPDDFLVSASISLSWGHGSERSRSLLRLAIAVNLWVKYSRISLSTLDSSTPWSKKIWVRGFRRGRRNPDRIRGSGLPVMKNFTRGSCWTNRPKTERIAEDGSSSMHSSNASMTMTHEMSVPESGFTRRYSSWEMREVWARVGSFWILVTMWLRKRG
jgi:hypothetical protein